MKIWLKRTTMGVSLLVFLISGIILLKLLIIEPISVKKINDDAKSLYYGTNINKSDNNTFKDLLNINPEIKGWIKIENTIIDYPVVQSDELEFYLNHNYKKEPSRYGSIFIDSKCKDGVSSKNVILHGHNMRNGEMFAGILDLADLDFYKSSPIIEFNSTEQKNKWKIISVFKTNTLPEHGEIFNYLAISFMNDNSFLDYVYNVKLRSLIETGIDVKESDQLLTLSTCSYEFDDFRTVVVARKIRPNESEHINLDNVNKNENPLMPECWYKRYGGQPPVHKDFSEDYQAGKIDWYIP